MEGRGERGEYRGEERRRGKRGRGEGGEHHYATHAQCVDAGTRAHAHHAERSAQDRKTISLASCGMFIPFLPLYSLLSPLNW